jgi:hypothetical protein
MDEVNTIEVSPELIAAVGKSEDLDSLTATYIQCRDGKEQIKRELTDRQAPLDSLMKLIEGKLLARLEKDNVESVRTSSGTIYKMPKTSAKVADWQVLLEYIKKNDAFDLLVKNVSKDAVKARIEELNEIVPGVDMYTIVNVGIRRAT